MKFFIVLSAVAAVALAKPSHVLLESGHDVAHIASPLVYGSPIHVKLVPGAPIGHDGRVVDTPEVAHEKAQHHAAHINEKVALAHEAIKSADVVAYSSLPVTSYHATYPVPTAVAPVAYAKLVPGAPLGLDGRVIDTPEVAHLKAEHVAAHINQKVALAHEEAKSSDYIEPHVQVVSAYAPVYQKTIAPLASFW